MGDIITDIAKEAAKKAAELALQAGSEYLQGKLNDYLKEKPTNSNSLFEQIENKAHNVDVVTISDDDEFEEDGTISIIC